MSPAADDNNEIRHPRETTALFGHAAAEHALLDAYRGGRIPHAWLVSGEHGVGKATLAYRMARFVLAHPDPSAPAVQNAKSLAIPEDHPVTRRVAGQAHSDLLVLRRVINEKTGKLYTEIRVDDVRRCVPFFGSTAGEGGWRVAIIDSVDELNASGDNALLKVLEEPPAKALLLLVSNAPGRVLPTIRSRCRMLMLHPLSAGDVARAAAAASNREPSDPDIVAAAEAADGSVARALDLLEGDALELRQHVIELLARLPAVDPRALHKLGERVAGTEAESLAAMMDAINAWLSARLRTGSKEPQAMARVAAAWEAINTARLDLEAYNLDRKPFVFSTFRALAEAARK